MGTQRLLCLCPRVPFSNSVSQFIPPFPSFVNLPPAIVLDRGKVLGLCVTCLFLLKFDLLWCFPQLTGETQENNLPACSLGVFNHIFYLSGQL